MRLLKRDSWTSFKKLRRKRILIIRVKDRSIYLWRNNRNCSGCVARRWRKRRKIKTFKRRKTIRSIFWKWNYGKIQIFFNEKLNKGTWWKKIRKRFKRSLKKRRLLNILNKCKTSKYLTISNFTVLTARNWCFSNSIFSISSSWSWHYSQA